MADILPVKTCECGSNCSLDMKTPRNVYLSAFYKRSFAFYTVKHRMPVILTNLIDNLVRNKSEIKANYGEEAHEELKAIIGEISEFKYEIQTNKPIKLLIGNSPDINIYNQYIMKQNVLEGHTTHFHTIWLLAECYMYRRIKQIFETKSILQDYDYFEHQKQDAYTGAIKLIAKMSTHVVQVLNNENPADQNEFISMLKLNLWGNKCDLSLSLGKVNDTSSLFDTAALDPNILCDHSKQIWECISTDKSSEIIDIVLDNSGYEVFTDLCLADYIITKGLAKSIRVYVKAIEWFISDVTSHDFHWTIDQLKSSENENMRILGERWARYVEDGIWTIIVSDFWTLPFDFTHMIDVDPQLYKKLSEAKAVFFKGDLNYRKLFGEKNWDPTTSVEDGLQSFHPSKLCIIRTVKADIVVGIPDGVAEKLEEKDPKWMGTGEYGVIQFCKNKVSIE